MYAYVYSTPLSNVNVMTKKGATLLSSSFFNVALWRVSTSETNVEQVRLEYKGALLLKVEKEGPSYTFTQIQRPRRPFLVFQGFNVLVSLLYAYNVLSRALNATPSPQQIVNDLLNVGISCTSASFLLFLGLESVGSTMVNALPAIITCGSSLASLVIDLSKLGTSNNVDVSFINTDDIATLRDYVVMLTSHEGKVKYHVVNPRYESLAQEFLLTNVPQGKQVTLFDLGRPLTREELEGILRKKLGLVTKEDVERIVNQRVETFKEDFDSLLKEHKGTILSIVLEALKPIKDKQEGLEAEVTTLYSRVNALSDQVTSLTTRLQSTKEDINDLRRALLELKKEQEGLEARLQHTNKDINDLKRELQDFKELQGYTNKALFSALSFLSTKVKSLEASIALVSKSQVSKAIEETIRKSKDCCIKLPPLHAPSIPRDLGIATLMVALSTLIWKVDEFLSNVHV